MRSKIVDIYFFPDLGGIRLPQVALGLRNTSVNMICHSPEKHRDGVNGVKHLTLRVWMISLFMCEALRFAQSDKEFRLFYLAVFDNKNQAIGWPSSPPLKETGQSHFTGMTLASISLG